MAEKYTSQYTGLKIDEAIGLALLLNSLRDSANGLATLDANKRLIQMPTISEILSQTVTITNGTDFNNLKTPGVYAQPTITQTSNNTNMPVNTAFFLIVLKENINQTFVQIFIEYNGRRIYTRHWNGTIWGRWVRYLSDLDSTFESGTTYTIESSQQMTTGLVTESNKYFRFSIMLPKNNYNNLSAQILSLKCNIRGVDGKYLILDKYVTGGTELIGHSDYTVTPEYFDGQMLTILIEKANWDTTNNSPATIEINHFSIKFT